MDKVIVESDFRESRAEHVAAPQKTEQHAWGWIVSVSRYLFEPTLYFEGIASKSPWITAFIICSILTAICGSLMFPFIREAVMRSIPAGTPPEQVARIAATATPSQIYSLIFSPVMVLVKSALAAALLTMIGMIVSERANFKGSFSLMIHMLPIAVLQSATTVTILMYLGVDSIMQASDVEIRFGLDMFCSSSSSALMAIAHEVNIFNLLLVVYLMIGLQAFFRCSRAASFAIASMYCLMTSGLAIGLSIVAQALKT